MLINKKVVRDYYDKKQILNFSNESALAEEKVIMPYILKKTKPSILDLGCGNGRYAKLLQGHYREYVGIDFSKNFISQCQKKYYDNCTFLCYNAEEFYHGRYDIILILGMLVYLNDDDIKQLVYNCKQMLNKDGIIIVRDIIADKRFFRKNKLFHTPYQQIRRTEWDYYEFFSDFKRIEQFDISGTGFTGFIFKVDW